MPDLKKILLNKNVVIPENYNFFKIAQKAGLPKRECERALLSLSPQAVAVEKERAVSETLTELKLILNESVIEKLKRLKDLLSHQMPEATYGELLEYMTDETLLRLEKKKGGMQAASPSSPQADQKTDKTLAPEKVLQKGTPTPRKYIPLATRRQLWQGARGRCEYVSAEGIRCSSRHRLEIEHPVPLALGGSHEQPLKLLCKSHNIQQAILLLGDQVMKKHIPSLSDTEKP